MRSNCFGALGALGKYNLVVNNDVPNEHPLRTNLASTKPALETRHPLFKVNWGEIFHVYSSHSGGSKIIIVGYCAELVVLHRGVPNGKFLTVELKIIGKCGGRCRHQSVEAVADGAYVAQGHSRRRSALSWSLQAPSNWGQNWGARLRRRQLNWCPLSLVVQWREH